MDERLVTVARELAARDRDLERRAARLHALEAKVESVRAGAEAIAALDARRYAETARLTAAVSGAASVVEARRSDVERTSAELDAGTEETERVVAERTHARALDRLGDAEGRLERAQTAAAQLDERIRSLPVELARLARRAAAFASELDEASPGLELAALHAWAGQARATLFTNLGQLEIRRERIIREANELGTMLLGGPSA